MAGWVIVYLLVCLTGGRFSTSYLDFGWQLVPWDVLSRDPLGSVWYLHVQPPLWNLALGTLAWTSPFTDAVTLQVFMAAIGAVGAGAAAVLAGSVGLGRRAATAVALVATVHPETLRTAFEPTYELAISTLLLITAAVFVRAANRPGAAVWYLLVGVVTLVILTRSMYHPLWLLAVLGSVVLVTRRTLPWRTVLTGLVIPVILVGGWMLKNQVLFGEATLSSWVGMNMQRAVVPIVDADDLAAMYERGEVSEIAMIGPFGAYELYEGVLEPCRPRHDHPSVTEATRRTDAYSPNFNFECYLPLYEQAGRDARTVTSAYPGAWVEGRLWSLRTTFAVSDAPGSSPSIVLRSFDRVYRVLRVDVAGSISTTGWGSPIYGELVAPARFGLTPIAASLLLIVGAGALAWRWVRGRAGTIPAVVVFAGGTVAWTVIVGSIGELGEQARFRTMTDALLWTVTLTLVVAWRQVHETARGS
jgi:hypothetical protein